MVYTYTPAYYSSFQETITSICKSILLPFSHKNRRLPADQKIAKKHADNLKWQQESFHRMVQLIGLKNEGMVSDREVAAFRSHLLDTLIAAPADPEPPNIIRDKLLFLQELLYAKCVSTADYHSSKRPLLQRLAVQNAEIDCRDVLVSDNKQTSSLPVVVEEEEEWSVIELHDEDENAAPKDDKHNSKRNSGFKSLWRGKSKKEQPKSISNQNSKVNSSKSISNQNSKVNSTILMPESSPVVPIKSDKVKRKASISSLFQIENHDENQNGDNETTNGNRNSKCGKNQWGFDGFRKWRKSNVEEVDCLIASERSDPNDSSSLQCKLVANSIGEGPDTKRIKNKIHSDGSSSDFFIDKVLGDNIKKELTRIRSELSTTNANLNFTEEQMEQISTTLPLDKSDLNNFFRKSWCDRYGDVVLDVVKKEFKGHVGEMEATRLASKETQQAGQSKWVQFDDNEENFHPNLFSHNQSETGNVDSGKSSNLFLNNPFVDEKNPFWTTKP